MNDDTRQRLIEWIEAQRGIRMPRMSGPARIGGPEYLGEVLAREAAADEVARIIGYGGQGATQKVSELHEAIERGANALGRINRTLEKRAAESKPLTIDDDGYATLASGRRVCLDPDKMNGACDQ